MTSPDDVELRLERWPGDRVSVVARYGTKCASRVFEGLCREGELFVWVAEEFRLGIPEAAQSARTTCASR